MCVLVASHEVGSSAPVMHECAHLFDTRDAWPPSQEAARRMRGRNSSIGEPGGDPALCTDVVTSAWAQGRSMVTTRTAAPAQKVPLSKARQLSTDSRTRGYM